ncbi:hypothetical protein LTR70_001018 [Exophiala xenobiotica]|uniref:Uncharacterized protein n=1 Tax=Lithohypha guttulata TaxID=1690604 RepID=A0ABR0KMZ1_9EURO|nr:hypothetical protein LTR24_000793 [Lithohypha guttulata]KAK5328864.1 hypothetical protein LTR70_001018 [Exophiala xenobiotica]
MPRVSLLRAVLLMLSFVVSLIALWMLLPFPQIQDSWAYCQTTLQSGRSLTTVHPHGSTFGSPFYFGANDHRLENYGDFGAVILDWQLEQSHSRGDITLRIGDPQHRVIPDLGCEIDFTSMVASSPRFAEEICHMYTPAGDQDGLSLPYFDYADATLLYHDTSQTWQEIHLQTLVPSIGVLQIWKYMSGWNDRKASDIATIDDDDREDYLVVTFNASLALRHGQNPALNDVYVDFQDALLATRTYPVRRLISSTLTPLYHSTTWIFSNILYPAQLIVLFIFKTIVLSALGFLVVAVICWLAKGKPQPFAEWAKHFPGTRTVARKVFGAPKPRIRGSLGPLEEQYIEEDQYTSRPRPLTNPSDFFRSSSPLDDLLVTFNATKSMVQPIGQSSAYREPTSSGHMSARTKSDDRC